MGPHSGPVSAGSRGWLASRIPEKDVSNTDCVGRQLRYIWTGEGLFNEQTVRDAFASSPPSRPASSTSNASAQHSRKSTTHAGDSGARTPVSEPPGSANAAHADLTARRPDDLVHVEPFLGGVLLLRTRPAVEEPESGLPSQLSLRSGVASRSGPGRASSSQLEVPTCLRRLPDRRPGISTSSRAAHCLNPRCGSD